MNESFLALFFKKEHPCLCLPRSLAPPPRIGHESGARMSDPSPPPALTGHIDHADRHGLTGWAMDPARPGEAVELELLL